MNFDNCPTLHNQPESGVLFFKIMMRLEYALKAKKLVQPFGEDFKVDWDRFANERLGSGFFDFVVQSQEAETLINESPLKQIWNGEALEFRPVAPPGNIQELIGAVCRVRNNLFHGGKAGQIQHGRNEALISEAINVVRLALERDTEIKMLFETAAA
ncbi:MAG: hypothetical protein JJ931_06020 [Henriciella sp.]|nr:hypothetical protein [Henriciella sp.]MBO6694954.1 hypothetical protein [Henriciella sp.]